jgi:hypothetical protein
MQPHQPTLAEKLGTTCHVSPLLLKLKSHGLATPKEIAAAAIDRGCRHYAPFAEGLHKDAPGVTDEELAIALLSPCHPYEPQLIRIGSQLLSGESTDPAKLAHLAILERCGPIIKYIAQCGQETEPDHPFWPAILTRLQDYEPAPASIMSHISRFRIETGVTNPRRPSDPKIIWLRPLKQDLPARTHGLHPTHE